MTLREPLQQVLGDAFAIERELPGGGMAHLYVALDTALNRRVVVKVLPRERAEGVSAERFRGEIRTVAALQHPNIVGILAAGEVEGLPYYMMPYIEGESLRALLVREEVMAPRPVVAILRDVARACAYAHARGIVHRDIKPDNVLLSGGAALITDFGVAKALSAAQRPTGNSGTLTRDGYTVGTPMYMAPEQLAGDPHLDHRVDFYAMGVMAYEMLSGQVPFAHPTPRALLAAQLSEPPTPLRKIRPDVPIGLATLVGTCLQKDPKDRPQSADAILATLDDPALLSDEFLAGRSGESRHVPTVPVAILKRKRRLRSGVVAGGVLAVLAGAMLARQLTSRPPAPADAAATRPSVAVLPFSDESPDSSGGYLGAGLAEGVRAGLSGLASLVVAPRSGAERFLGSSAATADIGRELGVETLVTGRVTRTGDRVAVTAALVDAASGKELSSRSVEGSVGDLGSLRDTLAADAAQALSRRYKSLPKPVLRDRALFGNPRAYDGYLQGRYALRNPGDGALSEALQRFHEAEELDSLALPVSVGLAQVYTALQASGAIPPEVGLAKALGFAERAVALDSTSAAARVAHGVVLDELWRWDEGGAEIQRAVALDSGDAEARAAYGRHLLLAGDLEAAARELDAALALDPYSAEIAGLDGIAWVLQGQTKKGIEEARRGVDLEPGNPEPRLRLGAAYLYAGQPFDAVFTLAGAVELDPLNTRVQGMLGYAYAAMGQPNKAKGLLARLEKSSQRPGALAALGRIHIGLAQPDEALGLLERAAQQHDRLFATESLYTPIFEPLKLHPRFERLMKRVGRTLGR